MTSICFVGLDTYIFNPAIDKGYIGGGSIQQALLARAFVSLEYQVSLVFPDVGQRDGEVIDNIKVRKTCREEPRLILWGAALVVIKP